MPNQIMRGISEFGIHPSKGAADCTSDTINAEPNFADLEEDAHMLLVGEYAVDGFTRVADTRKALAAGVAVGVGFDVDQAFEDYDGGAPVDAPNLVNVLGGHWVYLVGYRTDADGKTVFIGRNSWGVDWGGSMQGDFEATEAWLVAAFDVIALDVREVQS